MVREIDEQLTSCDMLLLVRWFVILLFLLAAIILFIMYVASSKEESREVSVSALEWSCPNSPECQDMEAARQIYLGLKQKPEIFAPKAAASLTSSPSEAEKKREFSRHSFSIVSGRVTPPKDSWLRQHSQNFLVIHAVVSRADFNGPVKTITILACKKQGGDNDGAFSMIAADPTSFYLEEEGKIFVLVHEKSKVASPILSADLPLHLNETFQLGEAGVASTEIQKLADLFAKHMASPAL